MKIVILTGKFGMGHLSAAKNLSEQIASDLPEATIELADIYQLALPRHADRFYSAYATLMKVGGKAINVAYGKAVNKGDGVPASLSAAEAWLSRALDAYLLRSTPDVIITTYSLASRLVDGILTARGLDTPHITCITDVGVHNVWVNQSTALYLVACEETARELELRGVDAARIAITGVPVCAKLRQAVRQEGGGKRRLLLMGGGLGLLPDDMAFYRALDRQNLFDITVVTAGNRQLRAALEREHLLNTTVLGYCDNVPELMLSADALVSKPGGVSTFEAIHAQLPLLMFTPYLEQERKNCRYVVAHRMGQELPEDSAAAAARIRLAMANGELLQVYRNHMLAEKRGMDQRVLVNFIRRAVVKADWRTAS